MAPRWLSAAFAATRETLVGPTSEQRFVRALGRVSKPEVNRGTGLNGAHRLTLHFEPGEGHTTETLEARLRAHFAAKQLTIAPEPKGARQRSDGSIEVPAVHGDVSFVPVQGEASVAFDAHTPKANRALNALHRALKTGLELKRKG